MRNRTLTILALFLANFILAQTNLNLIRGTKNVSINKERHITTYEIKTSGKGDSILTSKEGQLIGIVGDSVRIKPFMVAQNIFLKDKTNWLVTKKYEKDTSSTIAVNINDIKGILITRGKFQNFNIRFGFAALVAALVVSPLVSIDYNNQTFNKNRYTVITGISLATFTTCMTLSLTVGSKKYKINGKKNSWTIKK